MVVDVGAVMWYNRLDMTPHDIRPPLSLRLHGWRVHAEFFACLALSVWTLVLVVTGETRAWSVWARVTWAALTLALVLWANADWSAYVLERRRWARCVSQAEEDLRRDREREGDDDDAGD